MALQFRSLFPLALPGMLALLGWWWFFSRKKDDVSRQHEQVEASAVELRTDSVIKEPLPREDVFSAVISTPPSVTEPPEKEPSTASKPSLEPPALLRIHPARRRSESSSSLPNSIDTRSRPGTRKDDSVKLELAPAGDEAKSVPPECPLLSPKGVPFPHEAAEVCKQESTFVRTPGRGRSGQFAAPAEKHGPGERGRETHGAEGTGDAVLGENVLEEVLLSQEHVSELENSKAPCLATLGGGGEKGRSGSPQLIGPVEQREECVVETLLSSFESAHMELAKDAEMPAPHVRGGKAWDRDLAGELGKEESLDTDEKIEQAAFQIISQVILEATEEVLVAGHMHQASAGQLQGQKEESYAPGGMKTVLGQDIMEPALAAAEAASSPSDASPPSPGLLAGDLPPPKTYVSCLSSPLSSPTKDNKPKNSAYPISLASCPQPATPLGESLDRASILVEEATCVSDNCQGVPSLAFLGHCSDSLSTSGLEDSGTETNSSPRDKAITPPLPESTVPFSNGVLKEELSDLGADDGWTLDAEADHSGGSDRNSMDSVDSCGSLRKTESFQNAQAGSNPKKVDLIIWEIEVPKLMLPDGITVEVIVVNQVNAGHLFVQQHTHPTFHALRSLDQQMYLCYSQPGIPTLPTPVEITVICAAPGVDGAWWRAQVVASYEETNEVEIRYVDYGGYKRVKVDVLRQIRSDFVTLPFQGAEVLLDSVMPLSDDDHFSPEADAAMSEMTGNTALLAQVTSYSPTGLPLIQLWSVVGDEVVLINRSLVERGLAQWVDSYYASL
ncbi:A-kinase anchor protein 1, mitochondrial isoform X2 [Nycticebus coucang]|uniref:A-kinase anchor protein 1, mitochondrial isoform X2 n=1 Tax=Nycticebus coucang TaxID=9470 RepID=UPI00234D6F78|nr:A-kinase anchor protein 1, mitochondrial isoform X2 [Nycticebus coucang]